LVDTALGEIYIAPVIYVSFTYRNMPKFISSGSPLEPHIGFSRAVRIGSFVAVAGTAPIAPDGSVASPGNVYEQTKRCLDIILQAIAEAGLTVESVIRTRVMLTDITRWEEAARAHGEVFGNIRPACTFVQVVSFINPGWLVELEADCVAPQ
jgi:enamine deaminase RidA (YjgF/YER057c/UK114 family)